MATVLGVDACKAGWVAVELTDGGFHRALVVARLVDLPAADVIAVDIPVGFSATGLRRADADAAVAVGARRSSVFGVPPRDVWERPTYAEANARCAALTGRGMSAQSYGLRAKVLEANADHGRRFHEAHPEVSFRAMSADPLGYAKRSWAGQRERLALLARAGVVLPDRFTADAVNKVAVDDVLDAAAVAWTAARVAAGTARTWPAEPQPGEPVIAY